MTYKNKLLVATIVLFGQIQNVSGEVHIQTFKKKYSWKEQWSSIIFSELKKDKYRNGETAMLNISIDNEDLAELDCHGYNKSSYDEKSDFWVVFFSALTRAESAFSEKAISGITRGHKSFGLLQLALETAKKRCDINSVETNVFNPLDNLSCGVKLMSWQLQGAPISFQNKERPDLEGQIFGKHMFQWGPLRQNDPRGRQLLIGWFKDHLAQLKFCQL